MDNAHAEMLVTTLPDDTLLMVVGALRIQGFDTVGDIMNEQADEQADVVRALWRDPEDPGIFDPRCTCTLRVSNPIYPDEQEARRIDFSRAVACPVHAGTPPERHTFMVTVGGCTNDEAHRVMTERLGSDEDYGFEYTLDWDEEAVALARRASFSPQRATDVALSINTISSAHFTRRPDDTITGVVNDASTGIEFDVRLSGDVCIWHVSDDDGATYEAPSLQRALQCAIEANTPGGTTT